ncbi:MAG TPA: hypothetical protein VFS34_09760 [Thermoanaerobaculia bacterium]|nr:hypothetical protein [Thermoanaerobaculia bacterium]
MTRRWLLAFLLAAPAAAARSADDVRIVPINPDASVRFVHVSPDDGTVQESAGPSTFCLKDAGNGGILQFGPATGAYVACGADGFFEQGVGTVTTQDGVVTLSHKYGSPAFQGLESVHATVNPTTGQGSASFNARDESHGTFVRLSISSANVFADSCGSCPAQTAINEGALNAFPIPTNTISFGTSANDVTVLQQFSLNSDFDGHVSRLVMGIGRQGAGPLSFQWTVYSDHNGSPGDPVYTSAPVTYPDFPGLPTIGIVSLDARIVAGVRFWAGIRYDPQTDPIYFPYGTNSDSPLAKIAYCEPGHACGPVTAIQGFDNARSLFISADYRSSWLASGGAVEYGSQPMDVLSEKCDGAYYRFDYDGTRLVQLYAENGPGTSLAPRVYSNAFARITPILAAQMAGLDGIAETRYNGVRYSAFSFTQGTDLRWCTRPGDATDYACHSISGFGGGTGHYTRIVGVDAGFEISFGNAQQDRIERWMITHGPTAWQTQPLNPLLGQIGNPEFGFPWFAAASSKVGVAYSYQTSTGQPQIQLTSGNVFYGPFALGTDVPPPGFNSTLATRMAADCTRGGLCVFGRYQTVSGKNLLDMVDFRASIADPEIRTWQIGSGIAGLQFGRAVSLRGRNETALYASYTPSSIADQYRLQLDGIDLGKYTKFTISYDFGAGTSHYPLTLSRADDEWGLAHKFGIDLLYKWDAGCAPARFRGHGSATGGTEGTPPPFPCQVPIVQKF